MRILQLSREDADAMLLEKGDALFAAARNSGHSEDSTDGGANQVRIIEVGQRVTNDDRIGFCCIGRAEHSTQVAWFLNAFQDHHPARQCGLENGGWLGIGLEEGAEYRLSFWARTAGKPRTVGLLDLTPVADPANERLLGVRRQENGRVAYSERLGGRPFAVYRFHRK